MLKKIIIVFILSFNICLGQLVNNVPFLSFYESNLDSSNLNILGLPLLNFDARLVSNFNEIISFRNQKIIIDLQSQMDNELFAHSKITNNLFSYIYENESVFYSFGLDHKFFMDMNLSKDLLSFIINGNEQYLNQSVTFSDTRINIYNYFALYFGYTRHISSLGLLNVQFNLIKGLSFIKNSVNDILTINTVDNFNSINTPFSTSLSTDLSFFTNNSKVLSDIGFSFDISLNYNISNKISVFANIIDLGFIYWNTNRFVSNGNYIFQGVEYNLDENIITEFNDVYDTLVNIFNVQERNHVHLMQLLPYEFNIGSSYNFLDSNDKLIINYQLNKMTSSIYGTASLAWLKKYNNFSMMPIYSFNKFNSSNLSFMFNKKWSSKLISQLHVQNILSFFRDADYYTAASLKLFYLF